MTEELKQAAQQALEALKILKAAFFKDASTPEEVAADGCDKGYEPFESTWVEPAHAAIASLERALTQRPVAQAGDRWIVSAVDAAMVEMKNISPPLRRAECERLIRAAAKCMPTRSAALATPAQDGTRSPCEGEPMSARKAAYFMQRFKREEKLLGPNEQLAIEFVLELLDAQQATPEPVGKVFYAADGGDDETGAGCYMKPCVHWIGKAPEAGAKLFTRPAPGVPEGWRITRTHDGIDVHAPNGASVYVEPKAVGERKMPEEVLHALCLSLLTAAQQGAEQ